MVSSGLISTPGIKCDVKTRSCLRPFPAVAGLCLYSKTPVFLLGAFFRIRRGEANGKKGDGCFAGKTSKTGNTPSSSLSTKYVNKYKWHL